MLQTIKDQSNKIKNLNNVEELQRCYNSTEASIEGFERFLLFDHAHLELEIVELYIRFRNLIVYFEYVVEFYNHLLRRLIEI